MVAIIKTYDGTDIVIPGKAIEEMGVKPGEAIVIRPRIELKPIDLLDSEMELRLETLDTLYGLWSEDDEVSFRRNREESWTHWQPPSLS